MLTDPTTPPEEGTLTRAARRHAGEPVRLWSDIPPSERQTAIYDSRLPNERRCIAAVYAGGFGGGMLRCSLPARAGEPFCYVHRDGIVHDVVKRPWLRRRSNWWQRLWWYLRPPKSGR